MSFAAPFRIVSRGVPRLLVEDAAVKSQQRAFSRTSPGSYPRTRPGKSATSRLQFISANEEGHSRDHDDGASLLAARRPKHGSGRSRPAKTPFNVSWSIADPESKQSQTRIKTQEHSHAVPRSEVQAQPRQQIVKDFTAAKSTAVPPPQEHPEDTSLPWYLRSQHAVIKPATPEHLLERQKIPEIPDGAPDVLSSLLQYVSTDLGVDYLTLLDLRSLDPPAALGSNLIMIIGTARGEKHLHVSADRLCRWLRSNHKLHPQADGLLGRNELKIKMRRRAKRLKVLAHVGSADAPGHDDGLRTGWVCVNVSGLPAPPASEEQLIESRTNFVGFGESSAGTTLVLHMLTEGKREELDLEKLWTKRLERRKLKAAKEDIEWSPVASQNSSPQRELIG